MRRSGNIVMGKLEEVVYGRPAGEALPELVRRYGASRVFLMVSHSLNTQTDEISKIKSVLGDSCVGVFDNMKPHTPRSAVFEAANMVRAAGADLVVTFGGGSITDGAKAVRLAVANDALTDDALDRIRIGGAGVSQMKPASIPQISIPTTLSAGEFSAMAGVTNEATQAKEPFAHPGLVPRAVILDPAVTRHTPMWLFLSTGVRAIDHCVEGICSAEANPFGTASALYGLSLLASGLPRAKADPDDMQARLDCQIGAWMSITPLNSGVPMGASHGIGYVLGSAFGIPHGYTSCVMLPAVMRWNRSANAAEQGVIARAMGEPEADAGDLLRRFFRNLGMPVSLADVKVGRENFERIAEKAMFTPWIPRNPRPIAGPSDVREILDLAAE